MKTTQETIITNIIKIRNDRSLTQAAVAQGINVDYSTYSKIESQQIKLTVERLAEIASCLGLDIIDIITYPKKYVCTDNIENYAERKKSPKVILQLELEEDKKEQVLKALFGEKELELFKL